MSKDSSYGVAVVGCGTVGGATAQLLTRDQQIITGRCGINLDLRHLVDVKFDHARELGIDEKLFRDDLQPALDDPEVGVVVELIGGVTIARTVIERAIKAGKNVVTANKALLAQHGENLYALARKHNVCLAFEASCAGGIPIIRALCDGLIANRIDAMYGIVNGTCNHVLTAMIRNGQSYAEALAEAQRIGLAEADPTLDVTGVDSAHKLAILAALAFGEKIDLDAIPVEGIDNLDLRDVAYGHELGYVIKLLAIAQRHKDGTSLQVRPTFISQEHPLAWVSGPFNAVSVYGHANGHTMYYGRGAGPGPTASAVVSDIVSTAMGNAKRNFDQLMVWPDKNPPATQLPVESVSSRYYIRMQGEDRPGVFAGIAEILGKMDISISSVLQHEADPGSKHVPVVITTAKALEGSVRKAIKEIDSLDVVKGKSVYICIVDEHPEHLS